MMTINMSSVDKIYTQAVSLPLIEKVRLMERLMADLEQEITQGEFTKPLPSWRGLCADLGSAPSAEEIDAVRQEVWGTF